MKTEREEREGRKGGRKKGAWKVGYLLCNESVLSM